MQRIAKCILLAFLSCFSVVTFAGGPEELPPTPTFYDDGVYVDVFAGYAGVNWADFGQGAFNGFSDRIGFVDSDRYGGITFGGDVGYRFNKNMALELGWFYLPKVTGASNITSPLSEFRVKSWVTYLALKVIVPLARHFDIFAKIGVGYRALSYSGAAVNIAGFGDDEPEYVPAIFGAGLQYWFGENWSATIQYLYVLNRTSGSQIAKRAPSANSIVGGIGYQFTI